MCPECCQTATRRFEKVCEILDKHQCDPCKLIPILQEVQKVYRYLPEEVLTYIATGLGLSPAKVYGVDVEQVAAWKGKLETQGEVAMLAASPGRRLAGCIVAPGGRIAGCVKAIIEKLEKAAMPAEAASPA